MSKQLDNQFLRFLCVGLLNTLFGYSVFSLLIFCKLHYTLACLLTTVIGVAFNFNTFGRMVFNNVSPHLIFRFLGVYVIAYFTGITLIKIGAYWITNMYLNGAIAIILNAPIAYFLNKYLVFQKDTAHAAH